MLYHLNNKDSVTLQKKKKKKYMKVKKRKEKESKRARREDKPFENPREQIGDSVPVNGSCFGSEWKSKSLRTARAHVTRDPTQEAVTGYARNEERCSRANASLPHLPNSARPHSLPTPFIHHFLEASITHGGHSRICNPRSIPTPAESKTIDAWPGKLRLFLSTSLSVQNCALAFISFVLVLNISPRSDS